MLEVQKIETFYGSSQVLFGIDLKIKKGKLSLFWDAMAWEKPQPCAPSSD